jgi:hypothetical protein|tara:strand:- start:7346 stop:7600 length:255 start_codon:yes stop_codon:yes gene_type:complete
MTKQKNKLGKLNNKELARIVASAIEMIEYFHHELLTLTTLLNLLIEFNGKEEEFKEFANKRMKENAGDNDDISRNENSDRRNTK